MHLPFLKYSPSGNTTLLVRLDAPACAGGPDLGPAERAAVAAEIIAPEHLGAEQVGFVRLNGALPRLDMMGGELCVNATRAMAALLLDEHWLRPEPARRTAGATPAGQVSGPRRHTATAHVTPAENGWQSGLVSVSGADAPLTVRARRNGRRLETAVRLDKPAPACLERLEPGLSLVRLPGITHLVLDADHHPLPDVWRAQVDELFARYHLLEEEAAGCIWLHRAVDVPAMPESADAARACRRLTPFVRVRATGTVCAESACGSGSLAAALAIARTNPDQATFAFIQPGGETLEVRLDADAAWISGAVRLIARGDVFFDCLEKQTP